MIVKSMLVKIGADTAEMQTGLNNARSSMEKHAKKFKDVGKKMMLTGVAITGAIGMMVKKASDAQETTSKFGTVFEDVFSEASVQVNELTKNYGLSDLAAKTMLSSTGDLLTGLGLGGEAALGLSSKTQQLAVDLASFSNFAGGAEGASEALTKAMLGERESVKALGIVITEEMVKEQLLKVGKQKLTGQALLQAKAEATLAIAVSQSKNAIGDYQRTSGSLANVTRELRARFEDLTVEIGAKLIPVVTSLAQTVRTVLTKVIEWIKENPKLVGVITKVALGVGALLAVLGPFVMILPKLAAGMKLVGKAAKLMGKGMKGALGPIGLLIAAAAVGVAVFMKLKAAKDEVRKADARLVEAQKSLRQKLIDMKNAAGMTGEEFGKLNAKYKGNIVAMTMAIHKGKEGEKLQNALAEVSKKHKEEIDKQRVSYESIVPQIEDYKVKLKEIPGIIKTMTDEINKATLSEYEYAKLTLEQKKEDRVAEIEQEILDETAREEAMALLKETHRLQEEELDKEHKKKEKERQKEQWDKWKTGWQAYWDAVREQLKAYEDKKLEIMDSINQMTMDELTYKMWAFDEEKKKQEEHINATIKDEKKRDELLALLDEEYRLKKEKAHGEHAAKLTDLEAATFGTLSSLYGDFIFDTLGAFEDWSKGSIGLLKGIGMAFKNLATAAIQALKDIVVQEALTAVKTLVKEKAKAIAKVITSVMALPFPANVIAVGGAIAAVTMLFSKLKLFGEGGIAWRPTLAVVGEKGPELITPLSKAGAGFGGGFILKQTNHFYGDISNVGDLDAISDRLGKKVQRAVEKGRK